MKNRPCQRVQSQIEDRLDDLLAPAQAKAVDLHLTGCGACRTVRADAMALRAQVFAPYAVAPLPDDLRARIEAAAASLRPARVSRRTVFLRYAASFAAGVLVTLALSTEQAGPPAPATDVTVEAPVIPPRTATQLPANVVPLRRIR